MRITGTPGKYEQISKHSKKKIFNIIIILILSINIYKWEL